MFGAYNSFPRRLGGGPREVEIIQNDLLESFGTAFDKKRGGYLWGLCYADARALWAGWQTNKRLLNQASPDTATWSLPKWEGEAGLSSYGLTMSQRRAQLVTHHDRFGRSTSVQQMSAALKAAMGDTVVALTFIPYGSDNAHVPTAGYPWGTVSSGTPWSSNLSLVNVKVQDVAGVSAGEFYERIGKMQTILNGRLNVWATFNWYKTVGFYLDQPNLDVALLTT